MPADIPGRGVDALRQLRAMTADICDVVPLTTEDDFHVTTVTMMTRNALLVDTRATDQEYDRTPAHVARGAMDHFQITLCVEGEMRFSSGRREVTMGPGAICLIDMAQPNRTVLRGGGSRTRLMAIILQRAMLAPRLAHPDEQRLNLAFRQLISPSAEDTRLIDLAVGMRFSSDSTFIRASLDTSIATSGLCARICRPRSSGI